VLACDYLHIAVLIFGIVGLSRVVEGYFCLRHWLSSARLISKPHFMQIAHRVDNN